MYNTKDIQNYTRITNKPLLYVTTGFALVLMVPISFVYAVDPSPNWGLDADKCTNDKTIGDLIAITCCWDSNGDAVETDTPGAKCQHCEPTTEGDWACGIVVHSKSLPTSDINPLQDGVLEQSENPTPRTPGQSILPDEGVLEQSETSDEKDGLGNPNIGTGILEQPESSNDGNIENNPRDNGVLKE